MVLAGIKFGNKLTYIVVGIGTWIAIYWLWWARSTTTWNIVTKKRLDTFNVTTEDDTDGKDDSQEKSRDLKIITWNLQGLMPRELDKRTLEVASIIIKENPDAAYFQELTPATYQQLSKYLKPHFASVRGTKSVYSGYFTGIFYRKKGFYFETHEVLQYANSVMDRTLLVVKLSLGKLKLALMTTHLESLPAFAEQRKQQLRDCFETCSGMSPEYNVIFGGDLNLEVNEEVGLVPENIQDLWEACGSADSSRFTWDLTENRNEEAAKDIGQPKRRYDRLYFRSSEPETLYPINFKLIGKQMVEETNYFPSDHWGLVATFQLDSTTTKIHKCTSF